MPKLPGMSGEEMVRRLMKLGFVVVRQRGSHVVMKKTDSSVGCVIPLRKELRKGTMYGILRQAGISSELLMEMD